MGSFILVAFGGGIGAMGRYTIGLLPIKGSFPLLTLLINLIGAILIGFLAGLAGQSRLSERAVLFWKVGICGGFTTFSTFSLESYTLLQKGQYILFGLYTVLSVVLCLIGVWLGQQLSQQCSHS